MVRKQSTDELWKIIEGIVFASTEQVWNVHDRKKREKSRDLIRRIVSYYQNKFHGSVSDFDLMTRKWEDVGESLYKMVVEEFRAIGRKPRTDELTEDAAVTFLSKSSLTKQAAAILLRVTERTIERYRRHGYKGIKLKRTGPNGRFTPDDLFNFAEETNTRWALLELKEKVKTVARKRE